MVLAGFWYFVTENTFSFQKSDRSLLIEKCKKFIIAEIWRLDLKSWQKSLEGCLAVLQKWSEYSFTTCSALLTLRNVFLHFLGNVPVIMKDNKHSASTHLGVNWDFFYCQCISTKQADVLITFFFNVPCMYCRPRISSSFVIITHCELICLTWLWFNNN